MGLVTHRSFASLASWMHHGNEGPLSIVSLSKIHAAPTLYEKLDEPAAAFLFFARSFGGKKKIFPTRAPFLKLRRSDEFVLTAPSISIAPIERVVSRNNFKIEKLGREGKTFDYIFGAR